MLGRLQPEISYPEETQGALDPETESGMGRGEVALHLKRVCSSSSWLPELLGQGRHKMQAQPSLCPCGGPENLSLSGLGLGSACNSGPAPCRAAWSLSSVDEESTCAVSGWGGGKSTVAGHCECSPHMPVTFVCSAPPSPQHH